MADAIQVSWVAKITDFGLAKIIDLAGDETRTGAIIGTPSYMSPEQAKAEHGAIGPATDIYALGAILYELLTDWPPFRAASDAETLRLVVAEEPVAPRRLNPACPSDLGAICLKCLEKEPARRYASAGELAADLRRFMAGEPTQAQPLSVATRVVRWSGRNRRLAALLAAVAGLLLCVTFVSTVAAVHISRARDEAERALVAEKDSLAKALAAERIAAEERAAAKAQAAKAAQVSDFLVNLFMTADPMGTGKLGFRHGEEVAQTSPCANCWIVAVSKQQRALRDQPDARATLLDTLGRVYNDLGLFRQAEPLVREAYEWRLAHPENEADLATSRMNMGTLLQWKGDYAEAEPLLRAAIATRKQLTGPDSLATAEAEFALGLAQIKFVRAGVRPDPAAVAEFDARMRHVLEIQRRELGPNHRDVGQTLVWVALRYLMENKTVEMEKTLREAVLVFAQQEGGQSLVIGLLEYGTAALARRQGKIDVAERHYRVAISHAEKALGRSHIFSSAMKMDLGGMLHQQGRVVEFERMGREVLAEETSLRQIFPHGLPALNEPLLIWSDFVATQGKYDEAIEFAERVIDTTQHFVGTLPSENAYMMQRVASIRIDQGRLTEAAELLDRSKPLLDRLPASDLSILDQRIARAALELAQGNFPAAERVYRDCVGSAHWTQVGTVHRGLLAAICAQRPYAPEQLDELRELAMKTGLNPMFPGDVEVPLGFVVALTDVGNLAEAESALRPAYELRTKRRRRTATSSASPTA